MLKSAGMDFIIDNEILTVKPNQVIKVNTLLVEPDMSTAFTMAVWATVKTPISEDKAVHFINFPSEVFSQICFCYNIRTNGS